MNESKKMLGLPSLFAHAIIYFKKKTPIIKSPGQTHIDDMSKEWGRLG